MDSDLVLIGPNIPHLNFDYGVQTDYHQIVVQLKENFLGDAFKETPEFSLMQDLFKRAAMGLSFSGDTKGRVAEKLKYMQQTDHFEQLLSLLEIFQTLANSNEVTALNDQDTSIQMFLNDKDSHGRHLPIYS